MGIFRRCNPSAAFPAILQPPPRVRGGDSIRLASRSERKHQQKDVSTTGAAKRRRRRQCAVRVPGYEQRITRAPSAHSINIAASPLPRDKLWARLCPESTRFPAALGDTTDIMQMLEKVIRDATWSLLTDKKISPSILNESKRLILKILNGQLTALLEG